MDTVFTIIATILGMVGVCLNYAQLRRTPKPKPEAAPSMSVTIIGVPVHRVRDFPRHDR